MKKTVVHACPEDTRYDTLCHRATTDPVSCFAAEWTCRSCLRLLGLLAKVDEEVRRFRSLDEGLALVRAVVPGKAIECLDEGEARRVLLVLNAVAGGRR